VYSSFLPVSCQQFPNGALRTLCKFNSGVERRRCAGLTLRRRSNRTLF
jgi:hypothetical protein